MNELDFSPGAYLLSATADEVRKSGDLMARYGLSLSAGEIAAIAQCRVRALSENGRVDFGGGLVYRLIYAFVDSANIQREAFAATVMALIDSFYYFKTESDDLIADDDLIAFMRAYFDGPCQGSLEMLNDATLHDLLHHMRQNGGANALRIRR